MPAAAVENECTAVVILANRLFILDTGKLAARRGRKVMGPSWVARLPKG